MKKIFTISTIFILSLVVLAGCTKNGYHNGGNDQDYWMSKEYGVVAYADGYCPYIVIETYRGYTIMQTTSYQPYEGDEVYGDLSFTGYRNFYNYTDNSIFRGEVTDYWLSYADAQYLIDNLCYNGYKGTEKKTIKQGLLKKK